MDRFNSFQKTGFSGAQNVVSGEGGSTELLGEGSGLGELLSWCLLRDFSLPPLGAPGPMGRARAPYLALASLAVHVGERERFTGGQDGGSSSL